MKRRNFFKTLGVGMVATSLAPSLIGKEEQPEGFINIDENQYIEKCYLKAKGDIPEVGTQLVTELPCGDPIVATVKEIVGPWFLVEFNEPCPVELFYRMDIEWTRQGIEHIKPKNPYIVNE